MHTTNRVFLSVGVTLMVATVMLAGQVKTDYDRNVDFGRYRTYSWKNVHTQDPLLVDRIKAAVNSALAAKGLTEVESDSDLCIMAMEMTNEHRTLNTYYDNYGGGWGWRRWGGGGFGTATTTEDTYTVGTLVIDLFDTKTKMLVWRGSASDTISAKSNRNISKLQKSVQKMFEHLPPVSVSRIKTLQ